MIIPNTPVIEVPLTQVSDVHEFTQALRRGLEYGLPGFAIRAANSHIVTDETVINVLGQVTGSAYALGYHQNNVSAIASRTGVGVGRLHDDVFEHDDVTTPSVNVHRTLTGAGKVTLANAGVRYKSSADESYYQMLKSIGQHLEEGLTDPDFMLPEVRTTTVSTGDIIVFPTLTRLGPTLHRFDTTQGPRDASATIYEPVRAPELIK